MKEYQGHRSYSAWDQSLFINNEYSYYRPIMDKINYCKDVFKKNSGEEGHKLTNDEKKALVRRVTRYALINVLPTRTPDGVPFNILGVSLAVADLLED